MQKIQLQYIVDGNKLTLRRPDRPDNTSTFSVDAASSPKRMIINRSPTAWAVYALEGATLRLCLMVDDDLNAGYPTALTSMASPKTDVLTLERR
jgi:uncharacterized protein (TIGR03067 family)